MVGIIGSRPITIRKDEESGPEKPKERGNRLNGSTWLAGSWNGKGMAGICTQ